MSDKYCHPAIILSLITLTGIPVNAQEFQPSDPPGPVQVRTTAVNATQVEVQLAAYDLGGSALADIAARVGVLSYTDSEVLGYGDTSIRNNLATNIQIQIGKANSLGLGADASGDNAIAIGTNSQATNSNSIAIGSGAVTTRDNQIVLGSGGNATAATPTLYTLPGLAPGGSFIGLGNQPNQTDDTTRLVTVDPAGNLGTSSFSPASVTAFQGAATSALTTVNQQLESIGALAAAFSALPAILPDGSSGGCGIGSGLFGSGVAGSIGCIGRFADNLYVNAGVGITSGYTTPFGSTASVGGRLGLFVTFP